MIGVGSIWLISITLLVAYAGFVALEARRGKRLILSGLRTSIDHGLDKVINYIGHKLHFVGRHIIKLSWYYSIHSALRAVLTILVKTYDRLESAFMANRERAKQIRAERQALRQSNTHLSQMTEHKAAVELSPSQKKKLKEKSLAGR